MRALRTTAILLLLSGTVFAVEIAELRNGFTIRHRMRETRDGLVRLYIDDEKKSFVDVPATEIQSYSSEPDPAPSARAGVTSGTAKPAKSTNQIVAEASVTHGVDSDFIQSVIKQESAGNANAVSRTGARGLMQLMPGTASQLGVQDSFSPEQNVHGGAQYLRELLERYDGDAIKALAAYNAGPGAVDRYKGVPPYRETQQYVQRVVRDYNKSKSGAKSAKKSPEKAKPVTSKAAEAERAAQ
jgi:soluble lytic murein transglycosylase-like protein